MFKVKSGMFKVKMDQQGAILTEDGIKRRISHDEARKYLNDKKVTGIKFVANTDLYNPMSSLLKDFREENEAGNSPYGERVIVKKKWNALQWRNPFRTGVNLRGRYAAYTESGEYIHDITINMREITGPLTDRNVDYVELLRCLYQLAHSGKSVTEEDVAAYRKVMDGRKKDWFDE